MPNDHKKMQVEGEKYIDYVKLIKTLKCSCIWERNWLDVNINTEIITKIKTKVKEDCQNEHDKKMLINILDGYLNSISNLNQLFIIMFVFITGVITGLMTTLIDKDIKYFTIDNISIPCVALLILAGLHFTNSQQTATKYNIIRAITIELLEEKNICQYTKKFE